MKEKKIVTYKLSKVSEPMVLRELTEIEGMGQAITVRAAKTHLSGLLEEVSRGIEVTITRDGEPVAVLSPIGRRGKQKVFTGTREHLKTMPPWRGGLLSEEMVREDRDGRGW